VTKFKNCIDYERQFIVADNDEFRSYYSFEEVLKYAITIEGAMSAELRDFSFSHTIFDKIIAEDNVHGSNDARILAAYVYHERKATVVAEKLHIHRNTVLYRIEKIEKRYGLNLSERWSRDRVQFDLSILYAKITRNPNLYQDIFNM
jgi:DNA-binding PucR family transcriptional regulator